MARRKSRLRLSVMGYRILNKQPFKVNKNIIKIEIEYKCL